MLQILYMICLVLDLIYIIILQKQIKELKEHLNYYRQENDKSRKIIHFMQQLDRINKTGKE